MVNKVDETVVDFFSVLLKKPEKEKVKFAEPETESRISVSEQTKRQELQALLSNSNFEAKVQPEIEPEAAAMVEVISEQAAEQKDPVMPVKPVTLADNLDDEFQVLYFSVAGLVLAVPLISLGGIINASSTTRLPGRPTWFSGVQTNREQKVNVVDTSAWVMPEKYTDELKASINYQYVVLLEGSNWGLACESLISADTIDKTRVNWRKKTGKRPWLAGVVKDKMCGILNVDALISMLDKGLNLKNER